MPDGSLLVACRGEDALTVLVALVPESLVPVAVVVEEDALPLPLVILVLAYIHVSTRPSVHNFAIQVVVLPLAIYRITCISPAGPFLVAQAVRFTVKKTSIVLVSIRPLL